MLKAGRQIAPKAIFPFGHFEPQAHYFAFTQDGICGAPDGTVEFAGADRLQVNGQLLQLENLASELVPGTGAFRADVVKTIRVCADELVDCFRQVPGESGRQHLVVHHANGSSGSGLFQHRFHEIAALAAAASHAIEPACTNHKMPAATERHDGLAGQFRNTVNVERMRRITLRVRPSLLTIENVVCAEMDKYGVTAITCQGQVPGPDSVHG